MEGYDERRVVQLTGMKTLLSTIWILVLCSACVKTEPPEQESIDFRAMVIGSVERPLVRVSEYDAPENCLTLTARHTRLDETFRTKIWVSESTLEDWEKYIIGGSSRVQQTDHNGTPVGVEIWLTVSFRDEAGMIIEKEKWRVVVPHERNVRGTQGNFEYEAVWDEARLPPWVYPPPRDV